MKQLEKIIVIAVAVALAGCESEPNTTLQDNIDSGNISTFDPSNGVLPFPNDLLFQGSTDGTLNIPVDDPLDLADPQVALNGMDGFSTVAPFSTGFAGAIDPATVTPATVRVFEVGLSTVPGGAVVGHNSELAFGVDFVASVSSLDDSSLVIVPLKPLKADTSYQVVITNGLMSAKGNAILPSTTYALAKRTTSIFTLPDGPRVATDPALLTFTDERLASLERLRELVSVSEATVVTNASPALAVEEIILSWSFTTQSIIDVLQRVETEVIAAAPAAVFNPTPVPGTGVMADVYVGQLNVPYYLTAAASATDPAPLASFWKFSDGSDLSYITGKLTPAATSTQTIPVLLTTPAGGCGGTCPVIIYQHGITTSRGTLLAIADAMAAAGFAVIGIDLPLHGITGNETDGTQALKDTVNGERTFDLDLVQQDADGNIVAQGGDGTIDTSGSHFINLTNLQNSRDNFRQAVSDLVALRFALAAIDFNGAAADGDLDTSDVKFIGHSLGGMVGLTFLAIDTQGMGDAVIAMSGGGIAKLLDGSARFGPSIAAGLAASGVVKGTADFESFLGVAQTAIDSGDPINHTAMAATGRGILFYEVVGGGGVPSDLVIPNRVPDANDMANTIPGPLSGTDPLVSVDADIINPGLGLTQAGAAGLAGPNALGLIRFNSGDHGSLLSPAASLETTVAMQTDAATFLATGNVVVSNSSIIVEP